MEIPTSSVVEFRRASKPPCQLWVLVRCCAIIALTGPPLPSLAQDEPATTMNPADLENRAQRIFEAKEAIAKEAASWAEQKPLFENLIALREKEIDEMGKFTETAQARIEDVVTKRAALQSEETERKSWRAAFEKEVLRLESSLREVIPLLPPPVKSKVGSSIARLEGAKSPDEVQLQERFRDILAILSAARDFDSRLTIDSEVREFEGKRYQIDVLYLGLDHAWYVDESGKMAGVGLPTPTGWVWREDRPIASRVRTAIEINRREIPPALVSLPFSGKSGRAPSGE